MNDQIKELAEQTDVKWLLEHHPKLEKFAEVIIKECMRMCEVTEMAFQTHDCSVEASGAITVKQFIEEHFGI